MCVPDEADQEVGFESEETFAIRSMPQAGWQQTGASNMLGTGFFGQEFNKD